MLPHGMGLVKSSSSCDTICMPTAAKGDAGAGKPGNQDDEVGGGADKPGYEKNKG